MQAKDEEIAAKEKEVAEDAKDVTASVDERLELQTNIADTEDEIASLKKSLDSVKEGSDEYIEIQSNIDEKQTELDGYKRDLNELGGEPTEVEIEVALGVWEEQLAQVKSDLENFLASNKDHYEFNVDTTKMERLFTQ